MTTVKTCFKCGQRKELGEFYRHSAMGDGHLGKCKDCTRKDAHETRKKSLPYYREYDRKRAKLLHRKMENLARTKTRRAKDDGYATAHSAVANAIKRGLLKRNACQMCGTTENVHAHHDDYSQPLAVLWLCPVHHKARHDFLAYMEQEAA